MISVTGAAPGAPSRTVYHAHGPTPVERAAWIWYVISVEPAGIDLSP